MDDVASPPSRLPGLSGKLIAGLVAVAVLVVAVLVYAGRNASNGGGITYLTATVQKGDLSSGVIATGPIVAPTAVPLNFKNSGKVAQIDVKVGDPVKAGQILATLDPTDFQFQLRQAQANLDAAQANYAKLVEGPLPADVEAARAAEDAAARQLADAQSSLQATREQTDQDVSLAGAGVTTAQTNLSNAQASLTSAQDQAAKTQAADQTTVANAQKNLDAVQASVAANQPVLDQQVEKAKDDLWSAQTSRDGICGRSTEADCDAANASVGAAQTAVNSARAQLVAGQKQGAQQIAQAQAQLAQAQSQLASDQAKGYAAVSAAQGQIKQANAGLTTAERSAADAQARATVSVQAAQGQVTASTSAKQTARATYDKTTSSPTDAEIANAKAQIAAQQALVGLTQANLDEATLKAPSAGVVTAINGAVGQWLTGGSISGAAASAASGANTSSANGPTNFISLIDLSDLQVQAQVNEADVSRVKVGQPVKFTVDAFPGQTFDGKVAVVQPLGTTSQNVVDYTVTIDLAPVRAGAPAPLLPGMTASVTILTTNVPNAVIIPSSAISFAQSQSTSSQATLPASPGPASAVATPAPRGGTATVIVVSKGTSTVRQIQVGASNDQDTQVVSGLSPGEQVAVGVAPANSSAT